MNSSPVYGRRGGRCGAQPRTENERRIWFGNLRDVLFFVSLAVLDSEYPAGKGIYVYMLHTITYMNDDNIYQLLQSDIPSDSLNGGHLSQL